ncbi:DUF6306 domain-containing protein [Sneathiella litorea]|uniref:DUF6306 domain-containing protein n=1 Tax=Sneathiella litorea TaxID=2606216 RepID=A0A6L8WBI1_9PROT|nr:DUF6306 domain-containing protein [Sneathiella litorea]MZR32054.1 hypothetical protein [Sneathiella litorea]
MRNLEGPGKEDNYKGIVRDMPPSPDENAENQLLSRDEILELLNSLLEAERAGARAVSSLSHQCNDTVDKETLHGIAVDEGRFCAMLTHHIVRFDGLPSLRAGEFLEKILALESFDEKLALLDRGQSWVVRKLQGVLPRIGDEKLQGDLLDMLKVHERNIEDAALLRHTR